jgi:DNA-directed RNA polymerase specialized sigma54-like protein
MKVNYTEEVNKSNELIIRELLSAILQVILKEKGHSDEEIAELLRRIYC